MQGTSRSDARSADRGGHCRIRNGALDAPAVPARSIRGFDPPGRFNSLSLTRSHPMATKKAAKKKPAAKKAVKKVAKKAAA
ncbi:hypothetical protein, partial [Enterobacter hormaechei]